MPDSPSREVEDAGTPAERLLDEQRAAAGLLDVVAMCGDGEDVHRRFARGGLSAVQWHGARLVVGVSDGVHVGDIECGSLYGDELVVDLRAVGGVEGVYLAAVCGVDFVEILDPAEAGEAAVVVEVAVGVEIRNRNGGYSASGGNLRHAGRWRRFWLQDRSGRGSCSSRSGRWLFRSKLSGCTGGALAVGTVLRADPEGVVVGEEHFAVIAV